MDILLSLPVVSYFWSTNSLTSWSLSTTSLNFLFFYVTWSTLVLSHSPVKIEIVGTTAIRLALWLIPSLIFLAFDTLLPSLSEDVKYGRGGLPRRDAKQIGGLVALAVFNLALETATEAGLSLGLGMAFQGTKRSSSSSPVFKTSTALPLPWQMVKHVGILFVLREVTGYYIHRFLLHGLSRISVPVVTSSRTGGAGRKSTSSKLGLPKLKTKPTRRENRIAALHQRYSHGGGGSASSASTSPFSLQRGTDHPIPFILYRFVPIYLPSVVLSLSTAGNLHLLTYFVFVALATLEETFSMSGYTFIPGIVMGGMVKRQARHYECGGKGNFGGWGVLDWIHGTQAQVTSGMGGKTRNLRGGSRSRGVIDDLKEELLRREESGEVDGVLESVWEELKKVKGGKNKGGSSSKAVKKGGARRRRDVSEADDEWRD